MLIAHDDLRASWLGAVSVERTREWTRPWRVFHEERPLLPQALLERAAMPAGVRLAFTSDTTVVGGEVETQAESSPVDLVVNGEIIGSQPLAGTGAFRFEGLPEGEKQIEVWLPQFGEFRLRALEVSDGATIEAQPDSRPRWVTYGSSITQCRAAASPTQTWPAIVARGRNFNLTCLGYGGQCHLDPLIARTMRELPADYLSMCVGINIYGAVSLNQRTFRPGICAFVQIVREKHSDTPFVVMSPIFSPPREDQPNAVGFTLKAMREEVAQAVEDLRAYGDRHVHYVDGLHVFGPDLAHLLPDDLHPNAEGYRRMGDHFLRVVAERFFR